MTAIHTGSSGDQPPDNYDYPWLYYNHADLDEVEGVTLDGRPVYASDWSGYEYDPDCDSFNRPLHY